MTKVVPNTGIKPDLKPEIEIERYTYWIHSSWEDKDTNKNSYIAQMEFYRDEAGESYFADVHFHGGSNPLPDPEVLYNPQKCLSVRLHFRISALSDIIDMLRNEKPVYLHLPHWNDKVKDPNDRAKSAHISTAAEYVGEGESP